MKSACTLTLIVFALSGCASSPPTEIPPMLQQFSGSWTEAGDDCANPHQVSFAESGQLMLIEYAEVGWVTEHDSRKVFRYRILDKALSALRVQLENEPRTDAQGAPVVWHLIAVDNNSYCWGRDDWPQGACTPPRKRCLN